MAMVVGDRVAASRAGAGTGLLGFPQTTLTFGTVCAAGDPCSVVWDSGQRSINIAAAALDKLVLQDPVYSVVRLPSSVTSSPEYRGIIVGVYNRQVNGSGAVTGPYYLVKFLNGAGYMELLASQVELIPEE